MRVFIVVKRKRECASERLPPDSTRNCNEKSIAEIGLNPSHCDKLDSTEPPILALEIVLRSPAPGLLRKLRLKLKHILALFRKRFLARLEYSRSTCLFPSPRLQFFKPLLHSVVFWHFLQQFSYLQGIL